LQCVRKVVFRPTGVTGLPTTGDKCWIDQCEGAEVVPFGAHSHHVRRAISTRHDELRDDLCRSLTRVHGLENHEVYKERWMDEFYRLRPGCEKDGTGERFDLAVANRQTGHLTVMDVVVSHPVLEGDSEGWRPEDAVEKAARGKHKVYQKWNVHKKDVVPLSFSTYNVWAKETFAYLRNMANEAAGEDEAQLGIGLFRSVRLMVAKAIVRGQGRVLSELNRRNGAITHFRRIA
jgi:hypothetical protein